MVLQQPVRACQQRSQEGLLSPTRCIFQADVEAHWLNPGRLLNPRVTPQVTKFYSGATGPVTWPSIEFNSSPGTIIMCGVHCGRKKLVRQDDGGLRTANSQRKHALPVGISTTEGHDRQVPVQVRKSLR